MRLYRGANPFDIYGKQELYDFKTGKFIGYRGTGFTYKQFIYLLDANNKENSRVKKINNAVDVSSEPDKPLTIDDINNIPGFKIVKGKKKRKIK
ncbi:MAG: hypothetical protein GF317_04860 [Candidatus Lokiarchaeota archaeon]|nr:hypothetical protein [Candidatus Lokiarchaeota archaeon]